MSQELFNLERGNPNNLAGLVVIYGKVIPPQNSEEGPYTGLYVSSNVTRLFKPEEREAFTEALRRIPIIADLASDVPTSQEGKWGKVHQAQRRLKKQTLDQIMGLEGDVINTGIFKTEGLAQIVYNSVGSAYIAKYADQWHARMDPEKTTSITSEDLTLIAADQLLGRLYKASGELIQGYDSNEERLMLSARRILTTFAAGTGLQREVEQLIDFAKKKEDPHRLIRVQKQAELLEAIRGEKYERAAHLRDEIKALG